MIVGYARIGAFGEERKVQVQALREAGCNHIYMDSTKVTARDRPEFAACLRSLRRGDTLVTWRLDRVARSMKHLVEVIQRLEEAGVIFRSLDEGIDTASPHGPPVSHIFRALARLEHSLIRERTLAGLNEARAKGRRSGRKPSLTSSDARRAAEMLAHPQVTKTEVASRFGVTRATLNKALDREGLITPTGSGGATP